MDREDNNTQFENNYLRGNRDEFSLQQNLVENLQMASGFGAGGISGVDDEIGVGIGGKFASAVEEENDEEEWKYIQEVQQSEKQQSMQVLEGDVVGVRKGVDGLFDYVGSGGGGGDGGRQMEVDDEEEAAIIKNDGDFSTTSTTTSTTAGEEENSTPADIEEEAEAQHDEQLQQQQQQLPTIDTAEAETMLLQMKMEMPATNLLEKNSPVAESSLASGENGENPYRDYMISSSSTSSPSFADDESNNAYNKNYNKFELDKENADPAMASSAAVFDSLEVSAQPSTLDLEPFSVLNPDAKEFIPIHSHPGSPISPNKLDDFVGEPEPAQMISPQPTSALPRHLLAADAVDDVVAQSPRKELCSDMDSISLPAENEFDHEAAKRPHEIEQQVDDDDDDDDLLLLGRVTGRSAAKVSEAKLNGGSTQDTIVDNENYLQHCGDPTVAATVASDTNIGGDVHQQFHDDIEYYNNFEQRLEHGPETSVDMDMDAQDMMKQSFYIESTLSSNDAEQAPPQPEEEDEPNIEVLLNTVQPIPNDADSMNNSFTEDIMPQIPNKELLNVEEKEVVSHSPSTEELQMNFRNEYRAFSNDIPSTTSRMDFDNGCVDMQKSFYMEHHTTTATTTTTTNDNNETICPNEEKSYEISSEAVEHGRDLSNVMDALFPGSTVSVTTNPFENKESIDQNYTPILPTEHTMIGAVQTNEELQEPDYTNEKAAHELMLPPTSFSTGHYANDEKYLSKDKNDEIDELEEKMGGLLLAHDGSLNKLEEVAEPATAIHEKEPMTLFTEESQDAMMTAKANLFNNNSSIANEIFTKEYEPFFQEDLQTRIDKDKLEGEQQEQQEQQHQQQQSEDMPTAIKENEPALQQQQQQQEYEEIIDLVEETSFSEQQQQQQQQQHEEIIDLLEETLLSEEQEQPEQEEHQQHLFIPFQEATVAVAASAVTDISSAAASFESAPTESKSETQDPIVIADEVIVPIAEVSAVAAPTIVIPNEKTNEADDIISLSTKETTEVAAETEKDVPVAVAIAAAAAATTTVAAVGAAAVAATVATKKTAPAAKKTTVGGAAKTASSATTATKSRTSDVKKSAPSTIESKKPTTTAAAGAKSSSTTTAAKPPLRTSATGAKTAAAATAEKKSSVTSTVASARMTTTARPATSLNAARKPLTAASNKLAGTKTASAAGPAKSNATSAARNVGAAKTGATRPATAPAPIRKAATSTTAATLAAGNNTAAAAAKPRLSPRSSLTSSKPNTLATTTTTATAARAKLSPRTNGSTLGAAKSPSKTLHAAAGAGTQTTTAATTNGVGKSETNSNANRAKTTNNNTQKTFTARPAPKTTSMLSGIVGGNNARRPTSAAAAVAAAKGGIGAPLQRKSSPNKLLTLSANVGSKVTPTKTIGGKTKTKDLTPKSVARPTKAATPTVAGTGVGAGAVAAVDAASLKEKQSALAAQLLEASPSNFNGDDAVVAEMQLNAAKNGAHEEAAIKNGGEENGLVQSQAQMALLDDNVA